ncbi:MAG: methylenetetrahydrofolate reductase [Solirubrobacterales bacterium]|nr:methylenetetrahydrofolate reductase [Solirubrobacterales bacterium]
MISRGGRRTSFPPPGPSHLGRARRVHPLLRPDRAFRDRGFLLPGDPSRGQVRRGRHRLPRGEGGRGCRVPRQAVFFDNDVYFEWLAAVHEAGIDVPVIPGILPIISRRACIASARSDARIPDRLDEQLAALGGDEEAELAFGIAYASRRCEQSARNPLLRAQSPGVGQRGPRGPACRRGPVKSCP